MSISKEEVMESTASDEVQQPSDRRTTDDALYFLERHKDENNARLAFDKAYMARLRRKIDFRLIPFMFLCYVMNFLDKVLLNYSNVMGLATDLHLKGNDYSNASSAFFIAVLIASMANTYLIQRLPTGKWLGANLFCWGIANACTAATKSYGGLLATRIFCGAFEAAVPPSLMLLCSQWYTRDEQSIRFSFWFLGLGFGQVFGGLISWAFQHVALTSPFASWRSMFVSLGCVTLTLGTVIFFFLPDTPMQARFLTDEEKVTLLEHVKVNQTGIENRRFIPRQVLEAITDIQLWALVLILSLQATAGGVITSYSATLITSFGYTPKHAALLNMGAGAVTIASTLFCGFGVRYFSHRWLFIVASTVPTIIGAALMAWAPDKDKGSLLAGIYLVNTFIGNTPIIYQWLTANFAGHTKRAFSSAFLNGAFAVGNIIGPQTFQARDAPEYRPARVSMVATQSAALGVTVALFFYYVLVNKRRDAKCAADGDSISDAKAYAGLTDKQNKGFRYTY